VTIEHQLNLAVSKQHSGNLPEAERLYRALLAHHPDMAEAHFNLGTILDATGRWHDAIAAFRQAAKLRPDLAVAHWNLGLTLLRQGDYPAGWPEWEWRWNVPDLRLNRLQCRQPQWDGAELAGKRILLYAEQGFGDTIQFARYVPLVAARGGIVTLGCPTELFNLFSRLPGVETCLPQPGTAPASFSVHASLPSLPRIFGTTLATIPQNIPYMHADPAKIERWRARMTGTNTKKIGLVWAGRPTHRGDRERSLPLAALADLPALPGIQWFSLQKGDAAQQARTAPFELTDWTNELIDFSDTAALIANLDLVISVDTSVAHLAGAMGKPVWVLLPFVPDWRWLLERGDSPWYPTMRLFRQTTSGDWQTPLAQLHKALQSL
jgi:hypothetical protein